MVLTTISRRVFYCRESGIQSVTPSHHCKKHWSLYKFMNTHPVHFNNLCLQLLCNKKSKYQRNSFAWSHLPCRFCRESPKTPTMFPFPRWEEWGQGVKWSFRQVRVMGQGLGPYVFWSYFFSTEGLWYTMNRFIVARMKGPSCELDPTGSSPHFNSFNTQLLPHLCGSTLLNSFSWTVIWPGHLHQLRLR